MRWRGDRTLRLEIDGADELVEDMKKLVDMKGYVSVNGEG